jgi:hypothetical protein
MGLGTAVEKNGEIIDLMQRNRMFQNPVGS